MEPIGADFGYRRYFRAGAADEAFLEFRQLVWHDTPFEDLDCAPARQLDHGATGDSVKEAIGNRRIQYPVALEEDIGSGAFGHATLPVEHERICVSLAFGLMLGNRANHIKSGSF